MLTNRKHINTNKSYIPKFKLLINSDSYESSPIILSNSFTKIIDNLYLGDKHCANDQLFLHSHNIKVIINCADDCNTPLFITDTKTTFDVTTNLTSFMYVHFKIVDHSDSPINDYLHDANLIIYNSLKRENGVLIHCKEGISRSPTFIINYLMNYGFDINKPMKIPYSVALNYVKQLRPFINLKLGFNLVLRNINNENGFNDDIDDATL